MVVVTGMFPIGVAVKGVMGRDAIVQQLRNSCALVGEVLGNPTLWELLRCLL